MDIHQSQHIRQKVLDKYDENKLKQEVKEGLTAAAAAAATSPASPPSAASSPSHEFSFTISLHSSSTPLTEKAKPPPSFAIDLSPADEIFFHGHLLPLHLLSHLPVSPRSSTNSLDSFTLPIRELMDDQRPTRNSSMSNSDSKLNGSNKDHKHQSSDRETQGRSKNKSFSLFRLTRRRKVCEVTEREDKEKHKRRIRFDVNHALKKYARMIRALPFFRERRQNLQFPRQAYSFSGGSSSRNKHEIRGRRGEFSAPASMRTSPTNSGLLVATTLPSSTSDSTMEELQAAIQAAIAHCKNSIAKDEKIKC